MRSTTILPNLINLITDSTTFAQPTDIYGNMNKVNKVWFFFYCSLSTKVVFSRK
jgi:hypothetical protein